jgi:hypothetical protein
MSHNVNSDVQLESADKLKVTETTAFHDGTCSFCNDNIGSYGTIDFKQKIYEVNGGSVRVRFCEKCAAEMSRQIRSLEMLRQIRISKSKNIKHRKIKPKADDFLSR